MTYVAFHRFAGLAVGVVCISACDIEIPNNVFHCRASRDCPGGWVCEDDRCHEPDRNPAGRHGNLLAGSGGRGAAGSAPPIAGASGGDAFGPGVEKAPVPACRDKEPGSPVCDGPARASCSEDRSALESRKDCDEHAHCVDDEQGVRCACDDGYARGDDGACQSVNDCPPGACAPGGRCVDGLHDYSCVCNKGYEGTGKKECTNKDDCSPNPCGAFTSGCIDGLNDYTCSCAPGYTNTDPKTCSNVNECAEVNACSLNPEYPCRDDDPFYHCEGQFLARPMPDRTIGATKALQYVFDADALIDNVTSLRWQRELPAVYPKCSGKVTAMGDCCTWEEAKVYCEELVLSGYTEWRLPSKIELESLLDLTRTGSAMPDSLPALAAAAPFSFWSASKYSLEQGRHWYVDFREGWSYHGSDMFEPARVRCVR